MGGLLDPKSYTLYAKVDARPGATWSSSTDT
jgi:hypothetical protein